MEEAITKDNEEERVEETTAEVTETPLEEASLKKQTLLQEGPYKKKAPLK